MRGVTVRQIPVGKPGAGIKVVRLHYSADPTMTTARVAKLQTEYPDKTTWNREMEIDEKARSGQKVFPGFSREIHVVSPFTLRPSEWSMWLGCDPHPRSAHAFLWLAINRERDMVVADSYWPDEENIKRNADGVDRITIKEYAEKVKEFDAQTWKPPARYRVMDVAGRSFNATEETNYFDAYQKEGLFFNPAKKNRDLTGYDLINKALRVEPYGEAGGRKPSVVIFEGIGHNDILISRLEQIRFREHKGVVTDKNPPEEVEDYNRHLIDCFSYILLDEPRFVDPNPVREEYKPLYPGLGR